MLAPLARSGGLATTLSTFRRTAVVMAVTMGLACAASEVEDGTGAGPSSTVTGGAGGEGGSDGGGLPCGIDCSAIQTDACDEAVCNEATAQCEVVKRPAGTPCDDGLFCTIDDACDGQGICSGGPENDCGMAPGDCDAVVCDESSKACSLAQLANGTACTNSTDLCQLGGACDDGLCVGTPKDCFFQPVPNACHVSLCNPTSGMCEPVPGNEGQSCTDAANLCTVNNTCTGGVCGGGTPNECLSASPGCVLGQCDPTSGQCSCLLAQLDIGAHASTYTIASQTRGYWFTAPVSFTIKELRVPSEVGGGVQNIQVVKFAAGPPPEHSASTTAHTTFHYSNTTTGSSWVMVNIPVSAGETVGILGARGTSSMANSYGASNTYGTTIFGQAVVLHRLIYQANLYTSAAGPLSNESTAPLGRIEMKYGP
jgi:hypothetical protein